MSINSENKKLIKQFNNMLIQKIHCEIFMLEYKYSAKELHLVQVKDSTIISYKTKKRIFTEVNREIVLSDDPCNEDLYLFIWGLMTMVHIMDVHIAMSVKKILDAEKKH